MQPQEKAIINPTNLSEEYTEINITDRSFRKHNHKLFSFFKRFMDLALAIISLPFAMILIFIFSILIKLETPGRALYIQERVGLNGRYFKLYKLRSMYNSAEKNGAMWAKKDDPRVTKIGGFIRVTRIDELPQLINVIKGDMSIVGPRPERPVFTVEFEKQHPGFTQRLLVKPGLTGWAQVNGGYDITPKEKMNLDLYYIKNKGILLDLKIMIKTISVLLTGEGAR